MMDGFLKLLEPCRFFAADLGIPTPRFQVNSDQVAMALYQRSTDVHGPHGPVVSPDFGCPYLSKIHQKKEESSLVHMDPQNHVRSPETPMNPHESS